MANIARGFTYIVHIVEKYVYNNKTCWFYDSNGIRYTVDELKYIYLYKMLPDSKKYALGNTNKEALAYLDNMIVTSDGKLRKKLDTKIKVIEIKKKNRICVVIEDSKSGYNFYRYMIERYYREIDFLVESSYGNLGMYRTVSKLVVLNSDIDLFLVIYDNKLEDLEFRRIMAKTSRFLKSQNVKYAYYYPIALEEVLLSWINLYNFIIKDSCDLTIKSYIDNYMKYGKSYYKFNRGLYMLYNGKNTANLEVFLEDYLKSLIEYKKSYLNNCFYLDCCSMYIFNHKTNTIIAKKSCELNKNLNFNKFKSLVEKSLFCGIINLIDISLGLSPKYLLNWNDTEILYKLFI